MNEKYSEKGSNTLYKVWGIIVLVFASLSAFMYLVFFILVIAASSILSDMGVGHYPVVGLASSYAAVGIILAIIYMAFDLTIQFSSGILLIRDSSKSTGVLVVLAVIYFLKAFIGFISMILNATSGTSGLLVLVLFNLVGIGWDVATGVLLILKSKGADKGVDQQTIPQEVILLNSPMYGTIEGVFGEFKGRQLNIEAGKIYKIGREAGCDIQFVHPKVSRVHCAVCKLFNGRYQITDYSYNGTFYGKR